MIESIQRAVIGATRTENEIDREIEKLQKERKEYELAVTTNAGNKNYIAQFTARCSAHNIGEVLRHVILLDSKRVNLYPEPQIPEARQIENIKRNVHIERVEIDNEAINVYTREIKTTYDCGDSMRENINLGRFHIKWKKDRSRPDIYGLDNEEWSHPHPCIRSNGNVCLGEYEPVIIENMRAGRLDICIDTLIHFLHNTDSTQPYRQMRDILNE